MDSNERGSPVAVHAWPRGGQTATPTKKTRRSWFTGTPHKAVPKQEEGNEDLPLLRLTHFTKKVMVCFNTVRTGTTRTRDLLLENPCDFPQEVCLERFPEDKGFSVPERCWELDTGEEMRLPITWTPREEGNMRQMITFKCESAFRLQVILLGEAKDPPNKKKAQARRSTFSVHRKAPLKTSQPQAALKPSRPTMVLKPRASQSKPYSNPPGRKPRPSLSQSGKENRTSSVGVVAKSRQSVGVRNPDHGGERVIALCTPSPASACEQSPGEEFAALNSSLAEINGDGMPLTAEDRLLENVKRQTLSVCDGMSPLLQSTKPSVVPHQPPLLEEWSEGGHDIPTASSEMNQEESHHTSPKRLSIEAKTTVTKGKAPEAEEEPPAAANVRKNLFSSPEAGGEPPSVKANSPQEFEDSLNETRAPPCEEEDCIPSAGNNTDDTPQEVDGSLQPLDADGARREGESDQPAQNNDQSVASPMAPSEPALIIPAPSNQNLDASAFKVLISAAVAAPRPARRSKRPSDPKSKTSPPKKLRTDGGAGDSSGGPSAPSQPKQPRDRAVNRTLALRREAALKKSGRAAANKTRASAGRPVTAGQYKPKGPMKGVPMAKLCLLKSSKSAIPRHPMPFAAKNMFYDERWMEKQEKGFVRWLNHVLTPDDCPTDPSCKATKIDAGTLCVDSSSTAKTSLAPSKEALSLRAYTARRRLNRLRRAACLLFQSEPLVCVLRKLEAEIERGRIAVRLDRKLHADYGIKQRLLELFLSYNPLWLRIGLETTYGEILPLQGNTDVVGLSRFVITRLLGNPDIAAQYAHQTVPHLYGPGYEEALSQFTLKRFLVLVFFLDRAKLTRLIDHDPCLFCKDSEFKSSRDVLLHFSREYLRGEGDLTRHLSFMGYSVTHCQRALDEFDFSVTSLSSDLRCGVRLARVVELLLHDWSLSSQLRVPAISRLQKIHNTEVTLKAMRLEGGGVDARAIVDGHREKTLELLWRIIFQFQIGLLLSEQQLKEEIAFLRKNLCLQKRLDALSSLALADGLSTAAAGRRESDGAPDVYFKSGRLSLLLKWCQAVCSFYGLKVENFTVAFSDGRALCYLVHHYHPSLLLLGSVQETTTQTQYQRQDEGADSANEDSFDGTWSGVYSPSTGKPTEQDKLLANERENFRVLYEKVSELGGVPGVVKSAEMSNTIPDEKVVITYVSYLCARLLDLRSETRAARTIQMVWKAHRLRQLQKQRQARETAAQTIQHAVRRFLARRQQQRLLACVVRLQAARRRVLAGRRVQALRQARLDEHRHLAATSIQACVRGFLARRLYQKSLQAIVIQSAVRGYMARQAYLRTRQAVATLQAAVRCQQERRRFVRLRAAAVALQRRLRANRLGRSQRAAYHRQRTSCVRLQAAFRGYVQRQLYLEKRAAAVMIQAQIRAHQQRRQFMEMRSAALTIQMHYRLALHSRSVREDYLRLREAAVAIQSVYRGMMARRQAAYVRKVVQAQAVVRCFILRRKYLTEKRACTVLQAAFRGHSARESYRSLLDATLVMQRRFRALRDGRQQLREYHILRGAAITLQAGVRGTLARRRLAARVQAAVSIQVAWKGHEARRHYLASCAAARALQKHFRARLIAESTRSDYLKLRASTILIQSHCRSLKAHREFLSLRASCITIQSLVRMQIASKRYGAFRNAAVTLQRHFRAKLSGDRQVEAYRAQKQAAVVLQAWCRGLAVRWLIAGQRAAALQIQATYRAHRQRRRYQLMRSATLCLQKRTRAYLVGRSVRCVYLTQRASAVVIQAAYRAITARRAFLTQKQAAIRIQSIVRMRQARSLYTEQRRATIVLQTRYRALTMGRADYLDYQIRRGACITLQAAVRGHLVRREMRALNRAAVVIQASYRASSTRARYLRVRSSALVLQSRWRATRSAREAREDFTSLKDAALVLQSAFRGKLGRCIAREHFSARVIQSYVRMHHARQRYVQQRRAAVKMQSAIRMHLARSRFAELRQAAVILQTRFRAQKSARAASLRYQIQRGACITLQAVLRGFLVRRQVATLHGAAVQIQKSFRRFSARSSYRRLRGAAVVFQTRWRATRQSREVQHDFASLKRAAVVLQSAFRGRLGRRTATKHRCARTIQSLYRMHVARQLYQAQRRAAVEIQAAVRMHQARSRYEQLRRATVAIQTRYRATKLAQEVTLLYQVQRGACITVQAHVRGHLVRQQVRKLHAAAATIQANFRAHCGRAQYLRLKTASCVLQKYWRATQMAQRQQREYIQLKEAALRMQSLYRGRVGRRIAKEHRSARLIQSVYRMHVVSQRYSKLRAAALTVQSLCRMQKARRHYLKLVSSAVTIQQIFRGYLASKASRSDYLILRCSAVTIQSLYRMHVVHQLYQAQRQATIEIQAAVRMHQARSRYAQLRQAAVAIQTRYRATKLAQEVTLLYQVQRGACITVQAHVRGHLVRQQVRKLHAAAATIQANFRAHCGRAQYLRLRTASCVLQRYWRATQMAQRQQREYIQLKEAALRMQSLYRGRVSRRIAKEHRSARLIQSVYRMHVVSQRYSKLRAAALTVQSLCRMQKARRHYLKLVSSAVSIQQMFRGYLATKASRSDFLILRRSAVTIQSLYRMHVVHQIYQAQRRAAIEIQAAVRMHQARSRYDQLRRAAVAIQTRYRATKLAQEVTLLYQVQRGACITVQAHVRGHLVRQQVRKLHAAAATIQANFRAHCGRAQYLRLKMASCVLQRYWRATQMAQRQQHEYIQLKEAALRMQSLYRGRVGRRIAKEHRAARLIQSVYRMHVVSQRYNKLRAAALTVQSLCRMQKARRHYLKLVSSAVTIQQMFRGYFATKASRSDFLILRRSAVTIQAVYRGFVQRRSFVTLREAAVQIQASYRRKRQQQAYQSLKRAAVILQTRFRACVQRNQAVRAFHVQRRAAITIQSAYKAHTTRQQYLRIQTAVTVLQASYRGRMQRARYAAVKRAAVVLQERFRAHLRMTAARCQYQAVLKAVVTIQAAYRGHTARQSFTRLRVAATVIQAFHRGSQQRAAYQATRNAALVLQRRYRACLLQRQAATAYHIQRGAAITIQAYRRGRLARQLVQRIRAAVRIQARVRMTMQRRRYRSLRAAADKMAATFRARRVRSDFLGLKHAAGVIQARYRAVRVMREQREEYRRTRAAAITIQSFVRGHQARKLASRVRAAVRIQSAFRGYTTQARYQRLRKSALVLQARTRGVLARREFAVRRRTWQAAACIQRHFRGYVARRELEAQRQLRQSQLSKFASVVSLHLSSMRIQRCYRLHRMRQAVRAKMQSLLTIQHWMRAKLQRLHFLKLRRGVVALQRRVRQHQAQRQRASVRIQAQARVWLARQYVKKMRAAALAIQSMWRGCRVRRSCKSKKVAAVRARCLKANRAATEDKKLCNRTTSALDYLLQYKHMSGLLDALISLDVVSRLSASCCLRLVEGQAVPVIFTLIRSCNRSLPCMEVIKYSVNILLNLAKYPPTAHAVFEEPESVNVILDLMQMYREKGTLIFAKVCMLMGTLSQDARRAQIILSVPKNKDRLLGIARLTERKHSKDAKRALAKSLALNSSVLSHSTLNASSLQAPTPRKQRRRIQPDWVLGRAKMPERTDPLDACHFVLEVLKLKS